MRRTKKEFKDYNVYRDRPFGLKWATAYAMDDLMKQVRATEEYALKNNAVLPRMSREEIDIVLSDAFLQTKEILIQLNLRDEYGRLEDNLIGFFQGEAYEDYFVFNDRKIDWEDVRHAKFTDAKKWSDIDIFEDARAPAVQKKESDGIEILAIKDEFYQPFLEELENDDN